MAELAPVAPLEVDGKRSPEGSLVLFFALTFVATWAFFVPAALLSRRSPPGGGLAPGIGTLILLGAFMPALVAIGLTARAGGRAGVRGLLGGLIRWGVGGRWYAFAAGYMVAVKLVLALLYRVVTGAWPRFDAAGLPLMIGATVMSMMVFGQAGEEVGWRGYALPRLAARLGLGPASIVLGVLWASWHLPLFFLQGADTSGQSFPAYLLQVTAISVAIAWLYWRTGGSLFLTMLMHAAINNLKEIVPGVPRAPMHPLLPQASLMSWLGVAVLWVAAGYFLVRMRKARLEVGDCAAALDRPAVPH